MYSMQAIGYVKGPYKDAHDVPRGLGAKHEAEGVLAILPSSRQAWPILKAFLIFMCSGFLIAHRDSNWLANRPPTIASTEFLRRAPRGVQTRSA